VNELGLVLAGTVLALAIGCIGRGDGLAVPATKLAYTDPIGAGAGAWQLVTDAASTDQRLVLDLLPPAACTSGQGLDLILNGGSAANWSFLGSVYSTAQVRVRGGQGTALAIQVVQAPGAAAAPYLADTAVLQVAVALVPGTVVQDIALAASQAEHLRDTGAADPITIAVGTLKAQ
jgi:hypothetical protein